MEGGSKTGKELENVPEIPVKPTWIHVGGVSRPPTPMDGTLSPSSGGKGK